MDRLYSQTRVESRLGRRPGHRSAAPLSTPASPKVLSHSIRQLGRDLPRGGIRIGYRHRDRVFVKETRTQTLLDRGELLIVSANANKERRLLEQRFHDPRHLRTPGILEGDLERLHLHHADVLVLDQDIGEESRDFEPGIQRLDEAPPPIEEERAAQREPDGRVEEPDDVARAEWLVGVENAPDCDPAADPEQARVKPLPAPELLGVEDPLPSLAWARPVRAQATDYRVAPSFDSVPQRAATAIAAPEPGLGA